MAIHDTLIHEIDVFRWLLDDDYVSASVTFPRSCARTHAKLRDPQDYVITGTPQSYEAYGCMVRKGDTAMKQLLDDVIAQTETSGKGEAIYKKWFMSPVPPKNLNLDFPMSQAMQHLFAHPNDKIDPEAK